MAVLVCLAYSSLNSSVPIVGLTSCFHSRIRLGPGYLARFLPLTRVDNSFTDVAHPHIILSLTIIPPEEY